MERLSMCRICLVDNVRMLEVTDLYLQETYEKITNTPFNTDLRPVLACFICFSRLKTCHRFMIKCLQAEELFSQLIDATSDDFKIKLIKPIKLEGIDITHGLTATSIQIINVTDIQEDSVKQESIQLDNELLKEERNDDLHPEPSEHNEQDLEDAPPSGLSDSEDDLPLTKIKSQVQLHKKRLRVIKKEKELKKKTKMEAREIMLTKQQQLENLVARSKTMNYINSPFKCEICYKGFVDTRAFENHKVKHDECSGSHICDICRMRYRTKQLLRTHAVTAHARIFKCNKCGYVTHTANQARVHEKWHNGHMYECQLCSQTFRKPTSYLSHLRKQHPTENVCDMCGDSFVGKHGLLMHKHKTHKNEHRVESQEPASERYCGECNIQFYTLDAWKRHILCSIKHTLRNEHSSQCSICGHRCVGNTSLATHMREHARSLLHARHQTRVGDTHVRCQCQQCGLNFVSRSKLQAHINRMHLGLKYNKNIVCEVCGKKCTSNATLRYHQRTHTGEKPYSCSSCSKQFVDSNQLRIHTRTHTGEKPYVCASCGKRFAQKPALTRHYRVHTGAKPYTCQYCSRTFSQSNSLKLHVTTVHFKQPPKNRKKTQNAKLDEKIAQDITV